MGGINGQPMTQQQMMHAQQMMRAQQQANQINTQMAQNYTAQMAAMRRTLSGLMLGATLGAGVIPELLHKALAAIEAKLHHDIDERIQ